MVSALIQLNVSPAYEGARQEKYAVSTDTFRLYDRSRSNFAEHIQSFKAL